MTAIIEIKPKNPYLRVNYNYIVDRMENEDLIVIMHSQRAVSDLGKNIIRRGLRYKMSKTDEGSWTIIIRKLDDVKADNNEKVKLLKTGRR